MVNMTDVIKTKYMIVASQYQIKTPRVPVNIHVDYKTLIRDETYKYLGVEIDESLTWTDHVDRTAKNVSPRDWSSETCRASNTLLYINYDVQLHCTTVFQLL